jgi:hypothetical protein
MLPPLTVPCAHLAQPCSTMLVPPGFEGTFLFFRKVSLSIEHPPRTPPPESPGWAYHWQANRFGPFTVPSCGLRVFYKGTVLCAPPTGTYSGSVGSGH